MQQSTGYLQYFDANERRILSKFVDYSQYQYPLASLTGDGGGAITDAGYKLVANDCQFIILRAGKQLSCLGSGGTGIPNDERGYQDLKFDAVNVGKFRDLGLKVGTYFYTRPTNIIQYPSVYVGGYTDANIITEATLEANHYADILETVFGSGLCGDILPVVDFEDGNYDVVPSSTMTSPQAYLWLKTFNDRMIVRFPQLTSIILYTGWWFVDAFCANDIRSGGGIGISTHMPYYWMSGTTIDVGPHKYTTGGTLRTYPDSVFTQFGGYETWTMWQYYLDYSQSGFLFKTNGNPACDMDVFDNINYTINDILTYPESNPPLYNTLENKANVRHTHNNEYVPVTGGNIDGQTRVLGADNFIFKSYNNMSWKMGRKSADTSSSHLGGDLAFIPSSDYWVNGSYSTLGETWDTTKAIVLKSTGVLSLNNGTDDVLTSSVVGISTASYSLPATIGWYRIAHSVSSVYRNMATVTIEGTAGSNHSLVKLIATDIYNQERSISLTQLAYGRYHATDGIVNARVVYYPNDFAGRTCYLEIYHNKAQALALNIKMTESVGWLLYASSEAGSIPAGHTSKDLTLTPGIQTTAKLYASNLQYDTAAPIANAHTAGDIVYNTAPAPSGYVGWVCTTTGTPGTWKGFGLIEA